MSQFAFVLLVKHQSQKSNCVNLVYDRLYIRFVNGVAPADSYAARNILSEFSLFLFTLVFYVRSFYFFVLFLMFLFDFLSQKELCSFVSDNGCNIV